MEPWHTSDLAAARRWLQACCGSTRWVERMLARVPFASLTDALTAARDELPAMASSAGQMEVRLALYRSWAGWPPMHPRYGGYQVPEHAGSLRVVSPRFIRHAHRAGLEVQLWTIDEAADMQRLLGWGVDALISNRPDLAVSVRNQVVSSRQFDRAARP